MSRTCTVCTHPQRAAIDAALVAGESSRKLSARYGTLGRMALQRHKNEHLSEALTKAAEAEQVAHADTLLDQVRHLQARTLAIVTAAEGARDLKLAVQAIREARGNLELLAKLLGELDERPQVNVLLLPEWANIRRVLMEALRPYAEARQAVAARLLELEAHDAGA